MNNLIEDPLISIQTDIDFAESLSLPELYARLVGDSVLSFPGLAAHQAPSWYLFLSQLAAVALHRRGLTEPPSQAEKWMSLLADLTSGQTSSAWNLVGGDSRKPAFLQPPTQRIDDFKECARTPDALDLLVKAKNHDRKQSQASAAPAHLWLYSLVNLQTTQGYSGRGQPGVARMNGGLSSRPLIDLRPGSRWGPRVVRSIHMLLARRSQVLRRVGESVYQEQRGLALTWLRAWDEDDMLSLAELDPYFIEVCRRIRLLRIDEGRIVVVARPAVKPRTNAKAFFGNIGDPWVPVNVGKEPPAALTVGAGGFDYRLVQRILLSGKDFKRPLALELLPGEHGRDMEIHLATLVRGQGKTEGFHERVVPLPAAAAIELGLDSEESDDDDADGKSSMAEFSETMLGRAGEVRKVLRKSVLLFLRGPDPNFQKPDAISILTRFDRRVDEAFFDCLFEAPERGWDTGETYWQRFLRETAMKLAKEAWDSLSAPAVRREKARAAAEAFFYGGLRRHLPKAFADAATKEQ